MNNTIISSIQNKRWQYFWKNYQLPVVDLFSLEPHLQVVDPQITEFVHMPPYAGPQDHDDIGPLLGIAKAESPKTILELGTAHGATTANLCSVTSAQIYTVNALPEQMEGAITTFSLSKDEIGMVYRQHGFSERVTQIYANTMALDLGKHLARGSIDLAIIDACHDTQFVLHDFMMVLPFLHSDSLVLLHDVFPKVTSHLIDSYVACMYLRKLGFDIQRIDHTWWGVWQAHRLCEPERLVGRVVEHVDLAMIKIAGRSTGDEAISMRWRTKVNLQQ